MTLDEMIKHIDEMLPGNRFENETKTLWINEVEGKIFEKLFWPEWRIRRNLGVTTWKRDGSGAWIGRGRNGNRIGLNDMKKLRRIDLEDPLELMDPCCCCCDDGPAGELEPYDYDQDQETKLLAQDRFSDVYTHYVLAKMHAADGEIDDYHNEAAMWRSAYEEYAGWHLRNFAR